jgi:CoA-transferase family III
VNLAELATPGGLGTSSLMPSHSATQQREEKGLHTNGETAMLSPYRVLDLTDEGALICGQILGDLGADVILVEPPGGVNARNIGPFCGDQHNLDRSLNFWALNRNKRSVTIDLETAAGRENLPQLVKTADILVESFAPRYLDQLGLGYRALAEINPGLIRDLDYAVRPTGAEGEMGRDRSYGDCGLRRAVDNR